MKKIFVLFIFTIIVCAFLGCDKDEINNSIKSSQIEMVNKSNHTYKIYIDDVEKGYILGKEYDDYSVSSGVHEVKVVQQDGYTFWATEETYYLECEVGCTTTKEFPESSLGKSTED